jgi:hypothetical protein
MTAAEGLPISEGNTPPEGQVQGMATTDDLVGATEEEAN